MIADIGHRKAGAGAESFSLGQMRARSLTTTIDELWSTWTRPMDIRRTGLQFHALALERMGFAPR